MKDDAQYTCMHACTHTHAHARTRAHRLAHSHYLVVLIETHAACGLSQLMQPLGL